MSTQYVHPPGQQATPPQATHGSQPVSPHPYPAGQPHPHGLGAFSHPLAALLSQSRQPDGQDVTTHCPDWQAMAVFANEGQVYPHAPQFETLTTIALSHPFESTPSQFAYPLLHNGLHVYAPPETTHWGAATLSVPAG
jgi:hypothetical protein